jgi:hypothetical protein
MARRDGKMMSLRRPESGVGSVTRPAPFPFRMVKKGPLALFSLRRVWNN